VELPDKTIDPETVVSGNDAPTNMEGQRTFPAKRSPTMKLHEWFVLDRAAKCRDATFLGPVERCSNKPKKGMSTPIPKALQVSLLKSHKNRGQRDRGGFHDGNSSYTSKAFTQRVSNEGLQSPVPLHLKR
jgi:hypothetical protein